MRTIHGTENVGLLLHVCELLIQYRIAMLVTETRALAGYKYCVCPRCGATLDREYMEYCDRCGQRLAWKLF